MPSQIQQKFFVIQEKAQGGSAIVLGPFYDIGTATLQCQTKAASDLGVAYVVVKTTAGFQTDAPQAVPLDFFQPAPGEPPLDL
jgi:hypothetical protein